MGSSFQTDSVWGGKESGRGKRIGRLFWVRIGLRVGENRVMLVVTSHNQLTTRTYILTVYVLMGSSTTVFPGGELGGGQDVAVRSTSRASRPTGRPLWCCAPPPPPLAPPPFFVPTPENARTCCGRVQIEPSGH